MTATTASAIVDLEWVEAHLDDEGVQLIEVDVTAAPYREGHIPGALLWNIYADLRHPDYVPASPAEIHALVERSGITPGTTALFYGYGAHLGYWLMRSLGHEHVLLLDGPRERWPESGRPWSTELSETQPAGYPLQQPDPRIFAPFEEMLVPSSDAVILDVRSRAEYDGVEFWPSGAPEEVGRRGHVPGAVHLPIDSLRTPDGQFRDPAEMSRTLEAAGVTPEKRVITYCTIGNRAAQAWYALTQVLDHQDAAVYAGSWAEWGFRDDTRITLRM
jgi:thiosulfate/3-mercaptopyruvate sulfurtransferase